MLSVVKRYLAGALSSYFPRTTEYLQSNSDGPLSHPKPSKQAGSLLSSKLKSMVTRQKAAPKGVSRKKTEKSVSKTNTQRAKPAAAKKSAAKAASKRTGKSPGRAKKTAEAESRPAITEGIYSGLLPVTPQQVQAMRDHVAKAVKAKIISAPSDEQWSMILSCSPATRIVAGAGSGKSTTLVLRVVFMLCHMNIRAEQITVISFTNDSCAQLREQLIEVVGFWQFTMTTEQARRCVRTFHSAMGALAKETLSATAWFEQLDNRKSSSAELDNPLAGGRLQPAQLSILKQAYQRTYDQVPAFRLKVDRLLNMVEEHTDASDKRSAPAKLFKLDGEFIGVPLFEAFYTQAGFIESLGLRVTQLDTSALDCSVRDKMFLEALALFWKTFEACLHEQRLLTFNQAFQALTDRLNQDDKSIQPAMVMPFTHLLIDEFQDISPQIVIWLQAVHGYLARQNNAPTIMAIGDDWQSIYGWRGSSPELFMDFDRYFASKGRSKKSVVLTLATNYRSVEPIIRDGEAVLADVAFKQDKASKAFKPLKRGAHGVQVITGFDIKSRLPELLADIQAQCTYAASLSSAERTSVLVLSRRNETLKTIQAQLDKSLSVKCYTVHRAKGLQAEVALIVDEGISALSHPLRNALYACSGFFRNSYDQAMADEALRLCYVAITRGVSRVLWYTSKPHGPIQGQ